MNKLKDSDVRRVLDKALCEKYGQNLDTKIYHELGILHGRSRIDIAVVNGILHGYEIKSESDNLLRLPTQIRDYNSVFDKVTIVTQRCHLNEIRSIVPKWWGIILLTKYKGKLNLRQVRTGKNNPNIDSFALSHFLWKNEAVEILKERDLHHGLISKPRKELYLKIAESLELDELKSCVSMKLRSRVDWLNN
ncbi:sce7726 family protein [Lysinibacillus capsici]|uniref:sce7726 family protein n=1 Tax=Lysinibacillus capsici TaxID=2115968 RepID=UPI002E1B5694|nr:sce7726 family protein [Lysinibacillus capsici]